MSLFSNSTFIVTEVKSDKILYMENSEYANKELLPGSLLKPFTLINSADDGDIFYTCTGWKDPSKRCWLKEGHSSISLTEALAYSCNSYFIQYLKERLDPKEFYTTLKEYLSFRGHLTEKDYIKESIGLGTQIHTTPIEMILAYNKLFREKPKGIEIIRQGMRESIYYGTGELFSDITKEIDAACKTGTSYRVRGEGFYDWRTNTGWFITLYPADDPIFSFLTVVDITTDKLAVRQGSSNFLRWINENQNMFNSSF